MELVATRAWGAVEGRGRVARACLSRKPIADQAGPLRQSLARYFRNRVPDPSEVDDLVQEVFARIVARDSEEPIEHLGGFVFGIAAHVLADRARRRFARKAEAHVEFDPDRHADEEVDPHRVLAGKEELRGAIEALLALPLRTRRIFVLHRLEGRTSRQVAEQLGISVSAVEKHMVRAMKHLSVVRKGRV